MKKSFKLQGLDCPHCAGKIERDLEKTQGVSQVTLSLMTQKLVVEWDNAEFDMDDHVRKVVKKYEPEVVVK